MSFDKKVMQRRSDIELLEMTTLRQNDYLPEAVEAAKMELESRALSPEKMKELRQRLLNKNLSKAERKQQKKHAEELLNEKSNELIDSINPLTEKNWRLRFGRWRWCSVSTIFTFFTPTGFIFQHC